MNNLLDDAAKRASRYLDSLNTRSVAPEKEAVAALARFDQAFPEHTSSAEAVLAELDEIGSPATMASAGGRFFGFVIGGALPFTAGAFGSIPGIDRIGQQAAQTRTFKVLDRLPVSGHSA
jgi:hypothetical protein